MAKGIIVAPNISKSKYETKIHGDYGINDDWLKYYALYWDRIELPNITDSLFTAKSGHKDSVFFKEGILTCSNFDTEEHDLPWGTTFIDVQSLLLERMNKLEPGMWSIAHTGTNLNLPHTKYSGNIRLSIDGAIPYPSKENSFEDILLFKDKYSDELNGFRNLKQELYDKISEANEIPRERTNEINRLEKGLADLNKISKESLKTRFSIDFKVQINLLNIAAYSYASANLAQTFDLSPALGAFAGAVATSMMIEFKYSPKPDIPEELKDYAYLHEKDDKRDK